MQKSLSFQLIILIFVYIILTASVSHWKRIAVLEVSGSNSESNIYISAKACTMGTSPQQQQDQYPQWKICLIWDSMVLYVKFPKIKYKNIQILLRGDVSSHTQKVLVDLLRHRIMNLTSITIKIHSGEYRLIVASSNLAGGRVLGMYVFASRMRQ